MDSVLVFPVCFLLAGLCLFRFVLFGRSVCLSVSFVCLFVRLLPYHFLSLSFLSLPFLPNVLPHALHAFLPSFQTSFFPSIQSSIHCLRFYFTFLPLFFPFLSFPFLSFPVLSFPSLPLSIPAFLFPKDLPLTSQFTRNFKNQTGTQTIFRQLFVIFNHCFSFTINHKFQYFSLNAFLELRTQILDILLKKTNSVKKEED